MGLALFSVTCGIGCVVTAEQPIVDMRDTRLALNVALDCIERILVTDKKRYGLPDVRKMLADIDLARSVLSDEEPDGGG
jgi:hypothetical protein